VAVVRRHALALTVRGPKIRFVALLALAGILAGGETQAQLAPGEIRLHLVPRRTVVLSSEIAAQIVELPVREGEAIKDGQRLVALDCAPYRAKLTRAEAMLARAKRQADVQQLLDGRCAISAPFGGRVVELRAQRWQFVREGEPVVEILDDREIEVEMIVPSTMLATLRPGTQFRAAIEETRKEYPVEVSRIAARIDPVSQTVKIFGRIVGKFPELLSGMSGQAILPADSR